jgi:ABC-type multidrug transport system ATPase subunit
MGEPEKICDRVGIMFAGRLVQVGTPTELKHSVSELSVVEVETPGLTKGQIEKLKTRLSGMRQVYQVNYADPKLEVSCERTDTLAEEVASALLSLGARIHAINTKDPTLEEAFIALTGGEEEIDRFLESAGQKT